MPIIKLVTAGPGAGKTYTSVRKIESELKNGNSKILPLTFSRFAAQELRNRLITKNINVNVYTLHSLCARKIIPTLGKFSIIDTYSEDQLLKESAIKYGISFQKFKNTYRYFSSNAFEISNFPNNIQSAINDIEKKLKDNNQITFDSLLKISMQISNENAMKLFGGHYILLDESQDMNVEIEYPLYKKIFEYAKEIVLFASPSQSIYSFRNANWQKLISKLSTDFPKIQMIEMIKCYRSLPTVIETGKEVGGSDAQIMTPYRKSQENKIKPVWYQCNENSEDDMLIKEINRLIKLGISENDIMVLHRTNRGVQHNIDLLRSSNIKYNQFNPDEILIPENFLEDLINLAQLKINEKEFSILKAITSPPINKPEIDFLIKIRKDSISWDDIPVGNHPRFDLLDDIKNTSLLSPKEFFEKYADYIKRYYLNTNQIDDKTVDYISQISKQSKTIHEFSEKLSIISKKNKHKDNGIKCMTMHACKGLESNAVIITGITDGIFPSPRGNFSEEKNVLFVAITRAKDYLTIIGNGKNSYFELNSVEIENC